MSITVVNSNVREVLDAVDWNFPSSSPLSTSIHGLHWYPGNFIPQIPSFLIQALSSKNSLVVDPFAGSGTTGLEAITLGRRAWMGDANQIALAIARAKSFLLTNQAVRDRFEQESQSFFAPSFDQIQSDMSTRFNLSPELATWFHPDTFSQLLKIWSQIADVRTPELREVFEVAFSNLLFSCASSGRPTTTGGQKRRHHWGWIADNVKPKQLLWHDAARHFRNALASIHQMIRAYPLYPAGDLTIERSDARSIPLAESSVDLVVTSPPYLAMIDYSTAQRLSYMWRNLRMDLDREDEVGARSRRNRVFAEAEYENAISQSVVEIERVLKPSAFCAIVIGTSRKYPDMAKKVVASFASCLETVWGPTARTPSRRRVSARVGEAPTEYICVFRKT